MNTAFRLVTAAALALAPVFAGAADDWLRSIPEDFEMTDQYGETHTLEDYQDNELVAFYVNGVGCPISRLAVPSFIDAKEQYEDQGVAFVMFNSSVQDDMARIKQEAEEFKIKFPIMKDQDQSFARALGVERTAEVFVVDPETREVVFRGPINDQLGYQTQRTRAEHEYLEDSLDTLLAGGTVDMDQIPDSKGCLVAIFDS